MCLNARQMVSFAAQRARYDWMRLINAALREKPNKVALSSFNGSAYSDNPRAISEALHAARPELDLVWLFEDPEKKRGAAPAYVRRVRFGSARALYELATARVWVDNTTKPPYVFKSPRQFYLQTWHGDRGFKTMLMDSPNYPEGRRMVEAECDLITTGSAHAERVYRSAFNYKGKFLRCGTPRNDLLFHPDPDRVARVRAALNIPEGAKVLLYAPTYRRDAARSHEAQAAEMDVTGALNALEALGGRWVCLTRGHTKVRGLKTANEDTRIIEASGWEDMAELLLAADVLISDYSSSVGDFALTGRPIILFQPDREHFSGDRTFYFDIDASPFWVARDQEALEARLRELSPEDAAENDREILRFFGSYETGNATEQAVSAILDHLGAASVKEGK
jgi:CDP-glycerol glycerophosphotransferase